MRIKILFDNIFWFFGKLLCYWANVNFCKWPNIENIIKPSGHTGLFRDVKSIEKIVENWLLYWFLVWRWRQQKVNLSKNYWLWQLLERTFSEFQMEQYFSANLVNNQMGSLNHFCYAIWQSISVCVLGSPEKFKLSKHSWVVTRWDIPVEVTCWCRLEIN